VKDKVITIKIEKGILHLAEPILIIPESFIIEPKLILFNEANLEIAECGQWVDLIVEDPAKLRAG
jgi:hypothetical protein